MSDRRNFRARHIRLVDAEERVLLVRHRAPPLFDGKEASITVFVLIALRQHLVARVADAVAIRQRVVLM